MNTEKDRRSGQWRYNFRLKQNKKSGLLGIQTIQTFQREHLTGPSYIGAAVGAEAGKNDSIF
jgi:hypothetical protein